MKYLVLKKRLKNILHFFCLNLDIHESSNTKNLGKLIKKKKKIIFCNVAEKIKSSKMVVTNYSKIGINGCINELDFPGWFQLLKSNRLLRKNSELSNFSKRIQGV